MKYQTLFDIRVRHSFYGNGRCADFRITPAADSKRVLRNHRLIVKSRPDGVEVLTPLLPDELVSEAGSHEPFIPFPPDMQLSFHLRLDNPDFALFTAVDPGLQPGATTPVYRNDPPASGARPGGPLRLHSDTGRRPLDVFAAVDIGTISAEWLNGAPVQFTIEFAPKQARWVYYVVTDKTNGHGMPRIADDDPGRMDAPLVFTGERLSGDDPTSDPDVPPDLPPDVRPDVIAEELAQSYPDHQRFRLVSEQAIPCSQSARKHLQLYLGDEALSDTLPNPSFRRFSRLPVQVGDTWQEFDSLFRVIKP